MSVGSSRRELGKGMLAAAIAMAAPSVTGAPAVAAQPTVPRVPEFDHIVVVMMENRDYTDIVGNWLDAPYINALAVKGCVLTKLHALTHPSEANYLALYAGTTFGIDDDDDYVLQGPTLATILKKAGKTFVGYVEHPNSTDSHNPWTPFPEAEDVEADFKTFPVGNFAKLPHVSFVIPNVDNDMHDGTIEEGDAWLRRNFDAYAHWAKANNSLLIVHWDEADEDPKNQVASIFYGAHVKTGIYDKPLTHYNLLSTLMAAHQLTGPGNSASAPIIDVFGLRGEPLPHPPAPRERGPKTPRAARVWP